MTSPLSRPVVDPGVAAAHPAYAHFFVEPACPCPWQVRHAVVDVIGTPFATVG
jgi:hypothetical protein